MRSLALDVEKVILTEVRRETEAVCAPFNPSLESPYRWRDWLAPFDEKNQVEVNGKTKPQGWKGKDLQGGKGRGGCIYVVNFDAENGLLSLLSTYIWADILLISIG